MARQARFTCTLNDGVTVVGYTFRIRGDLFKVQFPHRTQPGVYVEAATGIPVPKGFDPKKNPPMDWFAEAAKQIVKHYLPVTAPNPKTVTWEKVLDELADDTELRPRSLEVYTSTLGIFRSIVTNTKGPGDVTPEIAVAFIRKYASEGFKRSNKSDAKIYTRSKKTVENMVRRMTALWEKLKPKYVAGNPWENVKRPTIPTKAVTIPGEDEVERFLNWLNGRYPTWDLPRVFIEIKSMCGCRLNDLCQVRADALDPKAKTLTIHPDHDKTHQQRVIPLPDDICAALERIRGKTFLWESYLEDSKIHRPGAKSKNRTEFAPELMYHAMKNIFREYAKQGGKLRSHDLRKRALTLIVRATGSTDIAARIIGMTPRNAQNSYLDISKAFDQQEQLRGLADVLRPKRGNSGEDSGAVPSA